MKQIAFSSMILSLLVATSAIAQDVHYNFAWNTQFEKFRTYKWVEIKDAQRFDEMKDREIKAAVDAKLAKKRLTKTDADTADLYIGYQAGLSAEKQFASYNTDWGDGPGWYKEGWYVGHLGHGVTKGETSTIYAGQLGVDMYDSKHHYLVWRGVVSRALPGAGKGGTEGGIQSHCLQAQGSRSCRGHRDAIAGILAF